jgi:hypothetical protein
MSTIPLHQYACIYTHIHVYTPATKLFSYLLLGLDSQCENWSSIPYGSVNYIKYIHTLIVSEPNNVCGDLEGESEEYWKTKEGRKKEDKPVRHHAKPEGNEEKQSKCLSSTF